MIPRDPLHDVLLGDLTLNWIDNTNLWDAWMDGLRSPTYKQGFGAMLRQGCYCPLGVLCSVAGIVPEFPRGPLRAAKFFGCSGALSAPLAEFLNITQYGEFRHGVPAKAFIDGYEFPAGAIVSLNDRAHWAFAEQADYLTKHRDNMRPYGWKP